MGKTKLYDVTFEPRHDCLYENKDADHLYSNCTADQRLCFRCSDSTIPSLPLPKILRFSLSSETRKGRFVSNLVGNPEYRLFFRVAPHFDTSAADTFSSEKNRKHGGRTIFKIPTQTPGGNESTEQNTTKRLQHIWRAK